MDRFAEVRHLEGLAAEKIVAADRAPWWRLLRYMRLRREARELLAKAAAEVNRVSPPARG